MVALNTTINSRLYSVTTDEHGIDPLRDKTIADIVNIPTYTLYVVTQAERGRPDLVSFHNYKSVHLWWIVLVYNGLQSYRDIVEGITLKIPTSGQIVKYLTLSAQTSKTLKTFVI